VAKLNAEVRSWSVDGDVDAPAELLADVDGAVESIRVSCGHTLSLTRTA
jgi:hypothetical protein